MNLDGKKYKRTDLSVPYEEKEEAKALGAKWDYLQKIWYVEDHPNMGAFRKWLPEAAYLEKEKNHPKVVLADSPPFEKPSVPETQVSYVNAQDSKTSILMYWRSIEFFTPQKIPKPDPLSKTEPVFNICYEEDQYLFPWEFKHPFQKRKQPPKTVVQHLVYCAVYPHSLLKESLESEFGKDDNTFDARIDGECSVFALTLTQEGRPLFDTFVLSMSAWALSQLLNHKITNHNWLNNFDEDKTMLSLDLATHCKLDKEDIVGIELKKQGHNVGKPLDGTNLFYVINRILEKLNLKLKKAVTVRAKSVYVSESNAFKSDDQDFLNSFFVHDLKKIGQFADTKNIGSALQNYLSASSQVSARRKTDIRQDMGHVFERLAPKYFPKGRWPSAGHYPLVLSQQFAINSLFKKFSKNGGLFAVNGPPGTGKTTLLRDLIANVVVKRAECLAKYKDSAQVLSKEKIGWQSDKYMRSISVWPKEFEDFSVVISSSNNGAVENVTYEIPGESAIDASWGTYIDYFSSIAKDLIEQPSWALIAARLGNKSNRNTFIHKFWYGLKSDDNNSPSQDQTVSFLQLLKQYEKEESASIEWEKALVSFNNALDIEDKLRTKRIKWYELIESIRLLEENLVKLQSEKNQASENLKQIELQYSKKEHNLLTAQFDEKNFNQKRLVHQQFRPKLIDIIFTLGKAHKLWIEEDLSMVKAIKVTEVLIGQFNKELNELSGEIINYQLIVTSLDKKIIKTQKKLHENVVKLNKIRVENPTIPDINIWKVKNAEKELSSPWADDVWDKARTVLFLEAINLHKAFIRANASGIRKNLHAMMDILGGGVPERAPLDGVKAAWLTLFFVIPVISTTFASFDRLFKHLGKEDLGWLLVDEAAQATPQSAVGAMWRSKKVVVVGDPLQLEPIVLLPLTAQQALRQHFNVSKEWVPKWTSVQMLTDRVTPVGTFLPYKENNLLWVGSPLRVHRRCDNPMFSIVNKIAYDGLMVYGTTKRPPLNLLESGWIPVISQTADGHFIPEEGKMLRILLDYIIHHDFHPKNIFVISPFKQVIHGLLNFKSFYPELNIGTIHTTQGKEADIVILVLGGNPKSSGAKKWASENSNLLNVAISRAKRRLYVIGNRTCWKEFNYFDQMAKDLFILDDFHEELLCEIS